MHLHPLAFGSDWWLPPNYAVHGRATDRLFAWLLWICLAVGVGVELTLVAFVMKYRRGRGGRRPRFTHGNRAVELTWTLVPAAVLAVLALYSKRVWDGYRFSPSLADPGRTRILVIGQQFKWNVDLPRPRRASSAGTDFYPKVRPTSCLARGSTRTASRRRFAGVPGPASLPRLPRPSKAIDNYVSAGQPAGQGLRRPRRPG